MTKIVNPGAMPTSRRNVLRGSVLAGAAAMTGTAGLAGPRRAPVPKAAPMNYFTQVEEKQTKAEAAPADLSGFTRVKQELVAPPFALPCGRYDRIDPAQPCRKPA